MEITKETVGLHLREMMTYYEETHWEYGLKKVLTALLKRWATSSLEDYDMVRFKSHFRAYNRKRFGGL